MEKSDLPADPAAVESLTMEEHNNLLLRLTLVQLTSINSRLDNLETQISELLVRTTSCNAAVNSALSAPSNALPSTETPIAPPTTTTIIRYVCSGNTGGEDGEDSPLRISPDVSCMIEARVDQMRQDLLERVAQIMQESTMKTKGVVETSLNKMTDNITGIIDRNLTTMAEEIETLKRSVEEMGKEVTKKSRSNPPNREADLRNTMEKLRQNVSTVKEKCESDVEKMKEDQGKVREEIRVLREEIYQLKVRHSVEALSVDSLSVEN